MNAQMSCEGKRLLILGGSCASLDLIKNAREMGVITVVTDDNPQSICRSLADEEAFVSTTDMDGLQALIKERKIDGVFCGPSEFNVQNMLRLCELAGLPCYATPAQWDMCGNKETFKQKCIEYGVDCPREYKISETMTPEELAAIDYPIIVKPVDGCSSKGISVCQGPEDVAPAYRRAMAASTCGRIIAEKYIKNQDGGLFCVRYLLQDGEIIPYLMTDTYVVDPTSDKGLISAFSYSPSKYTAYYLRHMDAAVRRMIKGMGLTKGTLFFQAIPCDGKIYMMEMGYRLSGGMIFKMTQPLMGLNDMKMMIRLALGGPLYEPQEIGGIRFDHGGKVGTLLMVPLRAGVIREITGLEESKQLPEVADLLQYYHVGDRVDESVIGTLGQHFGRFTLIADSKEKLYAAVEAIQSRLVVTGEDGKRMNDQPFDLRRTEIVQPAEC